MLENPVFFAYTSIFRNIEVLFQLLFRIEYYYKYVTYLYLHTMRGFSSSQMYYHPAFWPEGLISLAVNVLIWGLVIYLIVYLVKKVSGGHGGCCMSHGHQLGSEEKDDSYYLNIAKERYAKGEIDKKHFDELKRDFSPRLIAEDEKTKE